jgi:heme exporter protein A
VLELKSVTTTRGYKKLFEDLNFSLEEGEALLVNGVNGSGKTTLLRILCGFSRPDAGEVQWANKDIRALGHDYSRLVNYLGHFDALKGNLTAEENLIASLSVMGVDSDVATIREALYEQDLHSKLSVPVSRLSAGQRKRVALARLRISRERPIWILDEPFVSLDKSSTESLSAALSEHVSSGGLLIYTTHQDIGLAVRPKILTMN